MTTVANVNDTTSANEMRALSMDEIDAVGGGMIAAGFAVGALVAYLGLHTAVEHYILTSQERWYAAR